MLNSIRYFEEICINRFEELENKFLMDPSRMAEYVLGITDELHTLGLEMIRESLELMDQLLQDSQVRCQRWQVESHSQKQLITSLGPVSFGKTLFRNKETGKCEYLLDRLLGLEKHERMTEDAEAKMLQEAVQTSYRRGGEECSLMGQVSKQTVKNKLHQLKFPKDTEAPLEKKAVDYLYIDADEDHVSLQFREKKGDLQEDERGRKNNSIIAKLVYVYEGIENESPHSKRHCLVNPYYFSRVCSGEANERFWDEVQDYISSHYDMERIKKIYVNGDGGGWIKAGMKRLEGITYVLDGYHLEKQLSGLTGHMLDSQAQASDELRRIIRRGNRKEFEAKVIELESYTGDRSRLERMESGKDYILSNWMASRLRLRHQEGVKGCSAEGHVSHVLSSRMSSRPMGWSERGAGKMVQLRAYYLNGGDMLELVRYQKDGQEKAAGAEYEVLSCEEVMRTERKHHGQIGKYLETLSHQVSLDTKKKAYFNSHIWGL